MQATATASALRPQNGRATRGTFMVILAVIWALFGLGCAAWTGLAFARQCESFLMTSSAARYTVLWTGGTWSAALLAAAWGVLRGKAWGAPAALWLCGWMVACLMAQVAGLLAGSGATASAMVGLAVAFVLLALVVRWFAWLLGPSAWHPKWLGVVGLLWTGWLWTSLVLPMLDPAANRPAGPTGQSVGLLGCAGAALLWLAAVMVARGRRRGVELAMACLTASAIAMSYAVVSGEQGILERFTFAALGACGMVKAGTGLEQLGTQYAGACTVVAMCAQAVAAIALLWWRRKAARTEETLAEQGDEPPVRSTEAGAVGTPRRFGIGTLMAVTAAFGGLMALLRAAAVPTAAAAGISAFVATVGAAQALLLKGRVPRVGSMVIGALFYVVAAIVVTQNAEPKAVPALLDHVPWLFVGGGILGYIAGATVAGFFMVLRNIAQRRKPRATSVPPAVAGAKPRRRWLRMPVRWSTLILLLSIPAGLWLGLEVHPLRRQARAAAALRHLGAEVEPEDVDLRLPWSTQPFLLEVTSIGLHNPEFADADIGRLRSMSSLKDLDLGGTGITDAAIGQLKNLQQLEGIGLSQTAVTGRGLAQLEGITTLVWLDISGTAVGDADLQHLRGLTALWGLQLDRTQVTGTGLAYLHQLPDLQWLWLTGTPVTEAGIEQIALLPKVRHLELGHCRISHKSLARLGAMHQLMELDLTGATISAHDPSPVTGFSSLKQLNLSECALTDSTVAFLEDMTSLQSLDLADTGLADAAMAHVASLSSLGHLDLTNTALTNDGLQELQGLASLYSLELSGTNINDDGLANLKGLTNVMFLGLSNTKVTDAGLEHLYGLPKLEWLLLEGTDVTDAGARALQHATPRHVDIWWTRDQERRGRE